MDVILEFRGRDFRVNRALADSPWRTHAQVWHRGDSTKMRRNPVCLDSGFTVRIAGANDMPLEQQIGEALTALQTDSNEVRRVRSLPGIESACVRFGELWWLEKTAARFSRLPTELLLLCGGLGLDIVLCEYLTSEDSKDKLPAVEPSAGGNSAPPRASA